MTDHPVESWIKDSTLKELREESNLRTSTDYTLNKLAGLFPEIKDPPKKPATPTQVKQASAQPTNQGAQFSSKEMEILAEVNKQAYLHELNKLAGGLMTDLRTGDTVNFLEKMAQVAKA